MNSQTTLYIVGAGPGDPELLTVKAARILKKANVVVYDRLVSQKILDLVPKNTKKIFAGKAARNHYMPQDEINKLLVSLAKNNQTVVRLKGGDPFIFGRGSEEALELAKHNVPFEIIPGITASAGCGSYAGIPLTHRGVATGVRFVTGHCRNGKHLDLNWQSLADPDTTLVIYMGLINIAKIKDELIKAGLPATTPAGAVERGTTNNQRTIITTLEELPSSIKKARLKAPSLLIIGRVVELAEELSWHIPALSNDYVKSANKTLLLAAHGSSKPRIDNPIFSLAKNLSEQSTFDEVHCGFLRQSPFITDVLSKIQTDELIVIPMLCSNGYITDELIPKALEKVDKNTTVRVLDPIGLHSDVPHFMAKLANSIIVENSLDPSDVEILIAAHGNKNNPQNADQTSLLAHKINKKMEGVETKAVFIEQPPLISDFPRLTTADNLIVIPYLIGSGLHAEEDIPTMLGLNNTDYSSSPVVGPISSNERSIWYCRAFGFEDYLKDTILKLV